MSPEQIATIESHAEDSLNKWNILIAQDDRKVLLQAVKDLQATVQALQEEATEAEIPANLQLVHEVRGGAVAIN